jgi:hypothetical protein
MQMTTPAAYSSNSSNVPEGLKSQFNLSCFYSQSECRGGEDGGGRYH